MVNLTREDSIGTWFSSTQMLVIGVVVFLVALTYRGKVRKGWITIACFFTYMGIDDAIKFHERIGSAVKYFLKNGASDENLSFFPSFTWQLVFGPFFVGMGIFIFVFLLKQLKTLRLRLLLISALGLYATAVGIDFVEGMDSGFKVISNFLGIKASTFRHFAKAFEEFLEMLGSTFFLWLFLEKLMECKKWEFKVVD